MHYWVKKGWKRAGNSNRPKMPLVRFDHLAQNGVKTKLCGMSDAFWGQINILKKGGKFIF